MSWITLTFGSLIGVLISSGIFSVFLAYKDIERRLNLSYSIFAFSISVSILISPIHFFNDYVTSIVVIEKINNFALLVAAIAFVFLMEAITNYNSKIFRYLLYSHILILIFSNMIFEYGMVWEKIYGYQETWTVFNESVNVFRGEVSYRVIIIYSLLISIFLFILFSSNGLRKLGDKKGALILVVCLSIGVVGLLIDIFILILNYKQVLFIDELSYLGLTIIITYKNYRNILESGKIRKELIFSKNQLHNILENVEEAIWDWDITQNKFYINQKFVQLINVHDKTIITQEDFINSIHSNDKNRIRDKFDAIKSNSLAEFKDEFRAKNFENSYNWLFIKAKVAEFKDSGLPKRVSGICLDITENKKQAEQIIQSEQRFREIFQNTSVGIYRSKYDGTFIMCNPAFLKIFGLTSIEDFNGSKLYNNGDREKLFLTKFISNDFIKGFEFQCLHSTGREIFIRESARAVRDSNNDILYFEGMIEDITEQKIYEKALSDKEFTYRQLFDLSPAGIVIQDDMGTLLDVNDSYCTSMGYSTDEIIGENIKKFVDPQHHLNVDKNRNRILSGQKLIHTVENLHKDGSIRYFALYETAIPLTNNKRGVLVICNDITETKIYESELVSAKLKAETADKLKSEFLAQISHEIRTPINTILSFVSLIEAEIYDDISEEVQESFSIIDSAGRRITRTVNLILDMSQIQSGSFECKFREYDLYEDVLYKIYQEYKKSAQNKKLTISINKKTDNTIHTFDEYTVNQIFQNLIDNAIKYTHKGSIELTIERNKDDLILVSVKDSGIGISEEYLPNLFDPFRQEEQGYTRSYDGNGLGLALVKQYCDMNNIDLEVKSKKGIGTEFLILFNNNFKSI